jgi:hypothetical protein
MQNKSMKLVLLGVAAYAIFASSYIYMNKDNPEMMDWDDRETFNREYIATLALSNEFTREQIIDKLGAPDINEAKQISNSEVQVMFYRTQHMHSDSKTTKDECTPLLFKNGKLVAWGEGAYEQYQALELNL